MTDYQRFVSGGVTYPVASPGTYSFLREGDPTVFYILEFFASVITTHIETRLLAEAVGAGAAQITAAVKQTIPFNPEPFLTQDGLLFPLLACYRKGSTYRYIGQRRVIVTKLDVAYVLPPVRANEAEAVMPALHAIEAILDNRTEQGFDPSYTPSSPTGTAGEIAWQAGRAGVSSIGVEASETGGYQPTADLYFPALVLSMTVEERQDVIASDFSLYAGGDHNIDLQPADEDTLSNVVQTASHPPPTLTSVTPNTGTKAGGTPVTVAGTGFIVGTTPYVLFGGAYASNVVVVNATSITCTTPAHDAQPTLAVDVVLVDDEQQMATLTTGFTFTSP